MIMKTIGLQTDLPCCGRPVDPDADDCLYMETPASRTLTLPDRCPFEKPEIQAACLCTTLY
jgi:hypothetical protein